MIKTLFYPKKEKLSKPTWGHLWGTKIQMCLLGHWVELSTRFGPTLQLPQFEQSNWKLISTCLNLSRTQFFLTSLCRDCDKYIHSRFFHNVSNCAMIHWVQRQCTPNVTTKLSEFVIVELLHHWLIVGEKFRNINISIGYVVTDPKEVQMLYFFFFFVNKILNGFNSDHHYESKQH